LDSNNLSTGPVNTGETLFRDTGAQREEANDWSQNGW